MATTATLFPDSTRVLGTAADRAARLAQSLNAALGAHVLFCGQEVLDCLATADNLARNVRADIATARKTLRRWKP